MESAVVLIDGAYLSKILSTEFNKPKIDLAKFSDVICNKMHRLRTYYYDCMPYQSSPPTEIEKKRYASKYKFISHLQKLPNFEVKLGKLKQRHGVFIQKRVDILMAVDLVKLSNRKIVNKIIIITGDSDFVPAIQAAKEEGVEVNLYYSKIAASDELFNVCDDYFLITKELIDSVKR